MLRKIVLRMLPFILLTPSIVTLADNGSVENSPKGFEDQYKELIAPFRKGDVQGFQAVLDGFKIPSNWFVETFGPAQGPLLEKFYGEQHDYFKKTVQDRFDSFGKQYTPYLHIELKADMPPPKTAPAPPPASVKPIPPVQKFVIKYSIAVPTRSSGGGVDVGHSAATWEDGYIYVDGKFRYFGSGAYPFWDPPESRKLDPCGKGGKPTGGEVIQRVEPVYPEEAKQKHVEGIVGLRVTVNVDGTVRRVEIIYGDPLLYEAAGRAVVQWKYSPFMNCGKPVEMKTIERLKFPPAEAAQ
jgi:TonB family protein